MYFVYITTNQINGKRYVGLCSKKKRGWETYLGSGKILKKAVEKYGSKNFTREIISHHDSLEAAISYERSYIIEHSCHIDDSWYNIAVGFTTQGFRGKSQTEYQKNKVKEYLTNKPRPESSKIKQSQTRLRKFKNGEYSKNTMSSENIEKIRQIGLANRGKKLSVETREKMKGPRIGKPRKAYTLKNQNEETITVNNLSKWCESNGINKRSLLNTIRYQSYHKGWKVIH